MTKLSKKRRHSTASPLRDPSRTKQKKKTQKTTTHDDEMLERLVQYKEEYGDCRVPVRWTVDPALGKWVSQRRKLKEQKKLSQDQIDKLDALGFVWVTRQRFSWDEMFERLVKFKEKNGHCLVPQQYREDPRLGRWVFTQRDNKEYRTDSQMKRLEEIGFVWSCQQDSWDQMFNQLVQYKATYGDCNVTQYDPQHRKLATWVKNLRLRRDHLSDDRVARLDEIGFIWCLKKKQARDEWDRLYKQLKLFKGKNGNCRVTGNGELARWIKGHRVNKEKLTMEQVKRLDSIGFEWGVPVRSSAATAPKGERASSRTASEKSYGTQSSGKSVPPNDSEEGSGASSAVGDNPLVGGDHAAMARLLQLQQQAVPNLAAAAFGGVTAHQATLPSVGAMGVVPSDDHYYQLAAMQPQSLLLQARQQQLLLNHELQKQQLLAAAAQQRNMALSSAPPFMPTNASIHQRNTSYGDPNFASFGQKTMPQDKDKY